MSKSVSSRRRYHLVLLSGPLFSSNMGCNALTYGTLVILSEVARRLDSEFSYSLLNNSTDGSIPSELTEHEINLVDHLPDFSIKGLLRSGYHRDFREKVRQDNYLKTADIFLDNGWGDSFSDIYGQARFDSVFRHYRYALTTGKPLILLPQTIGPFASKKSCIKAREMLSYAHAVYARDPLSAACAQQLLPSCGVFESIDVAMFMPYSQAMRSNGVNLRIAINPSGLLWNGGYTGGNQFNLKDDYQSLIRTIIPHLLAKEGVKVELIGHDIQGPNAGNTFDDYYVCKLLQREFPECTVGPFFYSPVEAKSYISGFDLLLGSRMHACIAAYSSGVPIFPMAYSRKFKGLFEDRLRYSMGADLEKHKCEDVISRLDTCLNQHFLIQKEFDARLKNIQSLREDFIYHLTNKLVNVVAQE